MSAGREIVSPSITVVGREIFDDAATSAAMGVDAALRFGGSSAQDGSVASVLFMASREERRTGIAALDLCRPNLRFVNGPADTVEFLAGRVGPCAGARCALGRAHARG
eukprot:SAG31_NODE_15490_length_752_cov_1.324655_1_plen_107_part_10